MAQPIQESHPGIPELAKQLGADAKQLVADEARLAKLELAESVHRARHGAMWLGAAFGTTVVALVAATIFLVAAIGRVANGNYWVGAFITAAIELVAGWLVLKRGLKSFKGAPYSMSETRSALRVFR